MGSRLQKSFHALAVAWYLSVDVHLVFLVITIFFSRWDLLFGQFGCGVQYLTMWNLVSIYFVLDRFVLHPMSLRPQRPTAVCIDDEPHHL